MNAMATKRAGDLTSSSYNHSPRSAISLLQRSSRALGIGAIVMRDSGAAGK